MPEAAPQWYALTQAAVCLGAAWAILAMYLRGSPVRAGEAPPLPSRDVSLLWLGLAVAVWGVTGLVLLLPMQSATAHALRPLLSCANSACLLISASHLDYGLAFLQRARDWPHWQKAALTGSAAVALSTLALYAALGPSSPLAHVPDVALSGITLLLYGFGLFRSFLKRGFASLAVLACVAIVLQSAAQLPEVTGALTPSGITGDRRWVLNLVSKMLTLIAFLSLAMSWVHEVARRPSTALAQLTFTGAHVGRQPRRRYIVRIGEVAFEMRETPHRDLVALAVQRLRDGARADGGWIALPDLVGRLDDSRIRRIREDLRPAGLQAAVESNFQKCYRLGFEPDRIGLDRDALASNPELAEIIARLNIGAT